MKAKLEYIKNKILDRNNKSLEFSMNHVHAEGLFSLVIDGSEFGKLTRLFIADKKINPFDVQLHTHRYPITLTVLNGNITHHEACNVSCGNKISEFNYHSFINGGNGLSYSEEVNLICEDYKMPIGSSVELSVNDIHTVSCKKDAIWLVEEKGFEVEKSKVFGVPFTVEGLYHKPAMFQINDKCQQVLKVVNRILEAYKMVELNTN